MAVAVRGLLLVGAAAVVSAWAGGPALAEADGRQPPSAAALLAPDGAGESAVLTDKRDRDPRPPLPVGLRQTGAEQALDEAPWAARTPVRAHRQGWPPPAARPRLLGGADSDDDQRSRG